MQPTASVQDSAKAKNYFEQKLAFTIGPMELQHMLGSGKCTVVDVRDADDYQKGHIPGAINLPRGSWDNTHALSRDKINVVYYYTQQCHLAANACAAFAAKWFPVMELEGGFETWKEAELEIEQGPQMKAAA
jgi:rhodanese-related sulfurtransferase